MTTSSTRKSALFSRSLVCVHLLFRSVQPFQLLSRPCVITILKNGGAMAASLLWVDHCCRGLWRWGFHSSPAPCFQGQHSGTSEACVASIMALGFSKAFQLGIFEACFRNFTALSCLKVLQPSNLACRRHMLSILQP